MTSTTAATPSYAAVSLNDRHHVLRLLGQTRSGPGVIVKAPPGAGKSTLVRGIAQDLVRQSDNGLLAIACQTNAQSDDLIIKLHQEAPNLPIARLHASADPVNAAVAAVAAASGGTVQTAGSLTDLVPGPSRVIIAPAAKWAHTPATLRRFAWMIVDECYQMRSDLLYYVAGLAPQTLYVGDSGQLSPFTPLDTDRWQALPYSPIRPAMDIVTGNHPNTPHHPLRISWRLPPSAAPLISECFYPDVPFTAGTAAQARSLILHRPQGRRSPRHADVHAALDMAAATGWAHLELPEQHTLPADPDIAYTLAALAKHALGRRATITSELPHEVSGRRLNPADLAIITARTSQAAAAETALEDLRVPPGVVVSTADRIQGREFALTLVWHPLAGSMDATEFLLSTGRMCVALSRHRHGCVIVGRAGVERLLHDQPDDTPVIIGEPGPFLDRHDVHWRLVDHLRQHRIA